MSLPTFVARHLLSVRLLASSSPNPPHADVPPPVYRKRGIVQCESIYAYASLYIYMYTYIHNFFL